MRKVVFDGPFDSRLSQAAGHTSACTRLSLSFAMSAWNTSPHVFRSLHPSFHHPVRFPQYSGEIQLLYMSFRVIDRFWRFWGYIISSAEGGKGRKSPFLVLRFQWLDKLAFIAASTSSQRKSFGSRGIPVSCPSVRRWLFNVSKT